MLNAPLTGMTVPAAAKAAARRITKKSTEQDVLRFLQLPLFETDFWEPEDRTETVEAEVKADAVGDLLEEAGDERVEWTQDEILDLHSAMLEFSLRVLAANGNPMEKLGILNWIFEPDYVGEVEKTTATGTKKVIVTNDAVPFSFAFCCRLERHDPEIYREALRKILPQELVGRYLASEPKTHHHNGHNPSCWEFY
ncbi:hypothetical protein [Azonexus hydrophilus]|uniref:Uncharacterized protein n=1 Tax=Azonexus hydrophilus TaxID=418702 RepID=A0ABZ2XNK9_9RHOO